MRQINSLRRLSLQQLPILILTTQAQRGMRKTVVAIGPISLSQPALAADAARGQLLAKTGCAECDIVAPGADGSDAAPAFRTVAKDVEPGDISPRQWLPTPHVPMPFHDLAAPKDKTHEAVARVWLPNVR